MYILKYWKENNHVLILDRAGFYNRLWKETDVIKSHFGGGVNIGL